MKRKITILTIAFLSSMLMYANAFAAATGRCGDSITWTLDDSGNLTLSGSGEMWNNGYDDSPFKDYEIRKVTVEYDITSIGEYAFVGCSGMTELTLPNSVTSIGGNAFEGCSGLTELTLPNGVRSIGDSAFSGCSGLTELTLPNSVTSIGDCAFYGCTGLTELILPNSVSSIGDIAFTYCSGLEKITVESGNSCYDSRDNCNSIIDTEFNTLIVGCKNSVIPNSVTSIGYYAFYGCSGLTELTLPDSVASIGDGAFICCSDLSKITSLAEIPPVCGSGVFDRVNKTNCELIVPEGSVAAYKQAEVWNEFSNISGFSGVEVTVAGKTRKIVVE